MHTEEEEYWKRKKNLFDVEKTLGMHLGYYEKGIRKHSDAVINLNSIAGKKLNLDKTKSDKKILDAGCGIGGTVIHLAKKYPKNMYYGLNITPEEIKIANDNAENKKVTKNTKFIVGDQNKTDFQRDFFDGIIAIESVSLFTDKEKFTNDAYRILKKGGKIVIIDIFSRTDKLNPFLKKMYNHYNNARKNSFYNENEWRKKHLFGNKNNLPNLESVDVMKNFLTKSNFKEIMINDITKNVRLSIWRNFLLEITNSIKKKASSRNR